MTAPSPVEQDKTALQQLVTALAYAQSAETVMATLAAFPRLSLQIVRLLFTIPQVRLMLRMNPSTGAHAATQAMYRVNLQRRAAYLVQAARRVASGMAKGPDGALAALDRERRYLEQHLRADAGRTVAAGQVAAVARGLARAAKRDGQTWNGLVGWYATLDDRTSPDCRKAHGRNFDPNRVPPIGFPGTVHPSCRCRPGPPFPSSRNGQQGSRRVEDIRQEVALAAVNGRNQALAHARSGFWQIRQVDTLAT